MKRINNLYGEAYNAAINNTIIEMKEAFGFELDPADELEVESMANLYGFWFDDNGELTAPEA